MNITDPYRSLDPHRPRGFWEHPLFLAAVAILMSLPLWLPEIPPLVDLPGHMARYRVQLGISSSQPLAYFYDFRWSAIGNLGLDLLIEPLSRLVGLERGVKLIVLSIPTLTAAGFLWVAREVHGRVPPTAFFALPFVYGYPFLFGFVNFALSMALAMLAFALWLRLGRAERPWLRAALFVPISIIIWFAHTFGWGTLGVLAFSGELVRQIDRGRGLFKAGFTSALHCLSLAFPLLLMLAWRSGHVGGRTGDFFNLKAKWLWIKWALRDRWEWFDLAALVIVALLLLRALRSSRIEFSRNLLASLIFLILVYLALPRIVFGSAYADMRLVPYLFAVALLAIRMKPRASWKYTKSIAVVALLFAGVRLAGTTYSMALYDRSFDRTLTALDHLPRGARLVTFVGRSCREPWPHSRYEHISGIATVRKDAFTNDQWAMPGAPLLTVHYPPGEWFVRDPSQMVTPRRCRGESYLAINDALKRVPRRAFDYIWLINPPAYDERLTEGLTPIWRSGRSVLYRVVDREPPRIAREVL